MKYEIEPVYFPFLHHHTMIGILTGLSLDEIIAVAPVANVWYTKTYITVLQNLGFSTNPRFKTFDPKTEYPCIMRCQAKPNTGYWYGWVYYDGNVYCTKNKVVFTLDDWIDFFGGIYRITSMLQVWI